MNKESKINTIKSKIITISKLASQLTKVVSYFKSINMSELVKYDGSFSMITSLLIDLLSNTITIGLCTIYDYNYSSLSINEFNNYINK